MINPTLVLRCALASTVVLCGTLLAATAGRDEARSPAFSRRFDYAAPKEIPIDTVVGRVHFGTLRLEVEQWKSGGYHLRLRLPARNPEGHDQTVYARVQFDDSDGKAVASDEVEMEVEEDEEKTVKLSAHFEADPAVAVATLLLELDAWDD